MRPIGTRPTIRQRTKTKPRPRQTTVIAGLSRYWPYAVIFFVILSFALIRLRLRDMPLERDEGEYAYAGQLILQGIPPYQLAYNMKLPGTYAAYAVILALFGETPTGVHCGLLLLNAATTLVIYFLGRRLSGVMAGLVAAAAYALLSTSPSVLGLAGHATHFVAAGATAGVLLLLRAIDNQRKSLLFFSGFLLGLAFLMKQPGFFFILFGAFYLARTRWKQQVVWCDGALELSVFLLGACLPFALTCVILLHAGAFSEFWFWTFDYARQYGGRENISEGIQNFLNAAPEVIGPSFPIWILAGVGVISPLWSRKARSQAAFFVGFLVCSFLAVVPGLYFRAHYFILLLPALALLAGLAVDCATDSISKAGPSRVLLAVPIAVFVSAFTYSLILQRAVFFELDPIAACVTIYGMNPFPEAVRIGEYLRRHTTPQATLAVLGSEPEIYFYSNRHSATGYIYTYPLMEEQKYAFTMQQQMIHQVETSRPEFLLYVDVPTSWLATAGSPQETNFLSWARNYIPEKYELSGIVDLLGQRTQYLWGDATRTYKPLSPYTIRIFKRKANLLN